MPGCLDDCFELRLAAVPAAHAHIPDEVMIPARVWSPSHDQGSRHLSLYVGKRATIMEVSIQDDDLAYGIYVQVYYETWPHYLVIIAMARECCQSPKPGCHYCQFSRPIVPTAFQPQPFVGGRCCFMPTTTANTARCVARRSNAACKNSQIFRLL